MFEPILGAVLGYMSEGLLAAPTIEQFKSALSDSTVAIEQKGGKVVKQNRIPMIGAANHDLWKLDSTQKEAIVERLFKFDMPSKMQGFWKENPILGEIEKKMNPRAYFEILKAIYQSTNNKGEIYECAVGNSTDTTLLDIDLLIAEVEELGNQVDKERMVPNSGNIMA